MLAILADRRILRSLDEGGNVRYEIFHDVLAQPVLAWRTGHEAERELERQHDASDRRHRQLLAIIVVGAVLLAVMGAVTVYAISQRTEAREQAAEARANALVASADAQLERDPELSLLLALEAARVDAGDRSERALRRALIESRVRGTVAVGAPLVGVTMHSNEALGVTEDGDLVRATPSGAIVETVPTGVAASDVSFARDGTALVTGRDGRVRLVGTTGRVEVVEGVTTAVGAAAISPDASRAVVLEPGGARLVELASGRTLHTYAHRGARSAAISPDNRRVLTGGVDKTVRVWSGVSGRRIHTLTEHGGSAVAVAYAPGGEFVASASSDGAARIWRTERLGTERDAHGSHERAH